MHSFQGSLQQRVLLTMVNGFSSARYFFFTCSAEMSVSLFTGCPPSESEGFHRGLGLGTTIANQISSPASLCRLVYIHSHCGQPRSFFLCCCVSCTVALLCAVVSLARLCGRPPHLCILSRLRLRPSCERLPCGIPSTECFVWSLHAHSLSLSLISSSSVVCSRSAPLHFAATMPRLLHHSMSQADFFSTRLTASLNSFFCLRPVGWCCTVPLEITTCAEGRSTGLLGLEATLTAQEQGPLFTSNGLRSPERLLFCL